MTDYKILGQQETSNLIKNASPVYSVPQGKQTLVRSINIANNYSSNTTLDLIISNSDINLWTELNSVFIAIKNNNATTHNSYAYSTDGIVWTDKTLPKSSKWENILYNYGEFIITSSDGYALKSQDGINWIEFQMPASGSFLKWQTSYTNKKYIIPDQSTANTIYYSEDFINWNSSTLPINNIVGVEYGSDKYVALGYYGAASSTDLITWTLRTSWGYTDYRNFVYGNGKFVGVATGASKVASSTDGISWTTISGVNIFNIIVGDNIFVGAATNLHTSTDAITWTQRTVGTSVSAIAYVKNKYIAIAANTSDIAHYSTDAVTWQSTTMPSAQTWDQAGAGTSYAPNNSDYIFKSQEILGNETITVKSGYTLDENYSIYASSENENVVVNIFGGEI